MALLASQPIVAAGLVPVLTGATATTGDTFAGDGRTFVVVNNASGSSINVTMTSYFVDRDGAESEDKVVAVANGARALIPAGPNYVNPADGLVKIVCSAVSFVTVGAVRLP